MKGFLLGLAYLCIWTTPIQVGIVLWATSLLFTTDASFFSLSNHAFLSQHLPFIHGFLHPMIHAILPTELADWVLEIPIIFHASMKAFFSTWFGLWLLPIAKDWQLDPPVYGRVQ